ncbi:hypothetical protein [Microseira sp. BLCC-F43]|jgi:hypothetical protein|uniref:hypothetical protein n=1 Tax=Microseira sp. BLCC-F43 TaxID=3153602 RepID=UPI0035B7E4F0
MHYKNGTIELAEIAKGISESRVIVTFLEVKPTRQTGQMIYFGMLSGTYINSGSIGMIGFLGNW